MWKIIGDWLDKQNEYSYTGDSMYATEGCTLKKRNRWLRCAVCLMACVMLLVPPHAWGEEAATQAEAAPAFLQRFAATDLDGNAIDESIFADYDLTMINIWATYCQPCINEMPDLGRLHADYAERGVQIIGLVADTTNADGSISDSQVKLAREIVQTTGAAYPHLLPSEDLSTILLWQIYAMPTTIFVNRNGDLVGYAYMGSADYDTWAQRIEETLALL